MRRGWAIPAVFLTVCLYGQQTAGELARAADTAPLSAPLRDKLGSAIRIKDWKTAEKVLIAEIERTPDARDLLLLAAGIFFLDGEYLNCAIAFKKAEKIAPLDEANRFTLAMAYVVLKRPDWARPELERLVRLNARNAMYPYWLGRLDYDARLYESAVGRYRQALSIDPDFLRAHDGLGLCFDMMGRLEEAVQSYTRASELNRQKPPGSPWPPLNLGILLMKLGRLEEAERLFRESARYDPMFADARHQLGVALEKQGKLREALPPLEEAIALRPDAFAPHLALARIYRALGNESRAAREFAEFRRLKDLEHSRDAKVTTPALR